MTTTRIRKTTNQQQYEELIDEYITKGYKTQKEGQQTYNLMKPNYGTLASHIIIAILTCWWTLFIGNIIWAIYNYYQNSDEILIKINNPKNTSIK
jgi:hypothetical protein